MSTTAKHHARSTIRYVLVVLTGMLICFGPCALVYNTWSIFVVPVSTSFGVNSSQFTFYVTVIYLIAAFVAPSVGNLMERFDLRIVLSASVLLVTIGLALCAIWQEIWQFYLSGFLEGLGMVALMFLAVPTLINRWFSSHQGLLIGLCFAMSCVGGAVFSALGGVLIANASWQVAYGIFALLNTVLALPATLFCIRSYPHEIGLAPYTFARVQDVNPCTAQKSEAQEIPTQSTAEIKTTSDNRPKQYGVSAAVMFRSPAFWCLMIAMGLFNSLTVVGNLFPSYVYYLGNIGAGAITSENAVYVASAVASCLMVMGAIGKTTLGALSDKTVVGALCLACGCGLAAILCMWFSSGVVFIVYAGAVLGGILYGAIDGLASPVTLKLTGPREYTKIYSRIVVFVNLAGAFSATAFAAVSEISWEAEWIMALGIIIATFILAFIAVKLGSTLEKTYE